MRVLGVVLLLLLAGCSASDEPVQDIADDTSLCISGVVVDDAIVPVAAARIDLVGTNVTVTAGDDGRFDVCNLAPGVFRLAVNATGYIDQEVAVTVPANATAPVQVDIRLSPILFLEPFSDVRKWDGRIMCGLRVPQNGVQLCGPLADQGLGTDDSEERYDDISAAPTVVQVEMAWQSTQPVGQSLRLMLTDDHREGLDNYAMSEGTSPIAVRAEGDVLQFKHLDSQGLFIRVFTGNYQDTGFSFTVEQGFTVFTSVYENYEPPQDWRYTDGGGLYPPP